MLATTKYSLATYLIVLFLGLVGFGVTGSSINLGLRQSAELVSANQHLLAGNDRPIRSDEWLVFTPLAIAQFNHKPSFPIINKNLGSDGQNMLVAGMAGVPVAHVSALVKPATWGFFMFDLRHALAWYWWFPIFGSLFAVWGTMGVLAPGRWGVGLATAGIFITSAYVVAWSNWPAYTVMFPALAFCVFSRLFKTSSWLGLFALGVALGLSVAGFVLVLYPPWQISVGYLFVCLTVAIVVRDRLWAAMNLPRVLALALSAGVCGLIIHAWWADANYAIAAMQSTVYPGQRTAISGGGMMWWESLRGFVNSYTLYYEGATGTNQSELSSFIYFFPAVILAACLRAFRKAFPSWPELALMAFCLWVLWFQFVGIPSWLAEWSLWGRVPPKRTDLALGLASILLCSLNLLPERKWSGLKRYEAAIIAGIWAGAVMLVAMRTPTTAIGTVNISMWVWLLLLVFFVAYCLLLKEVRAFLLASLFITCSISLPFNPLVRAPNHVEPVKGLLSNARQANQRVLVLGSQIEAMSLLAAGVPVANGVFYYPQRSLWKSLDPDGKSVSITNRYQHLLYIPQKLDGVSYRIESPSADVVRVVFDPALFDFRLTGAQRVLSPISFDLSQNDHLVLLHQGATFNLYSVN